MIRMTIQEEADGWIRSIKATGHAGYAQKGSDIICAAITALMTTVVGALQDIVGIKPKALLEPGHLAIDLEKRDRYSQQQGEQILTLMRTLELGSRQIEASYGKRYLQITHTKR